jgi:hypothetical protein
MVLSGSLAPGLSEDAKKAQVVTKKRSWFEKAARDRRLGAA